VDKTTIEANGVDMATFILKDENGKNLVDDANELSYIYFKNVETNENLPRRSKSFSMPQNGVYTFKATYMGKESQNTVTITVQNREKYERYFQQVALIKCTGTWCGPCAVMANYLENVSKPWSDHMTIVAAHASGSYYDPFASYSNELGQTLLNMYGGSGYPFLIYDAITTQEGSSGGSSNIEAKIRDFLTNYPATCGVAIRSTELQGTTLKIRAVMTSSTGGEYDMGYILLVDNQPYSGGTIESGVYNDIVFGHSSNLVAMNNQTKFTATADQEVEKEWTIENFPASAFAAEDVRILVYALTKTANRENIIDNLTHCPLGGSVDYLLNE
jgi:thiol-disulfide isomerase/thioredoxin